MQTSTISSLFRAVVFGALSFGPVACVAAAPEEPGTDNEPKEQVAETASSIIRPICDSHACSMACFSCNGQGGMCVSNRCVCASTKTCR